MTETAAPARIGLFHVTYESAVTIPGGIRVALDLVVSTPTQHISGLLHLSQATNPPLDFNSRLSGRYSLLPLPPHPAIVATLSGYPIVSWPKGAGLGPVLIENAEVHLVLTNDWQSATANISYHGPHGWQHLTDVKLVKAQTATV